MKVTKPALPDRTKPELEERMRNRTACAVLPLLIGVLACGTESGPSPTAIALAVVAEPSSLAGSGILLEAQPVVELRDANNAPVALRGVLVTADIASGGGTLAGTVSVRTADDGRAAFSDLVINGSAGQKTIRFSASGLTSALSAPVEVVAGAPAALSAVAGNNKTAPAGSALIEPPALRVVDNAGNPVSGVIIHFDVTAGGGTITGTTPESGTDGVGRLTSWTLGLTPGPNAVTATVGSLTFVFHATGVVGVPARLTIVSGDQQTAVIGAPVAEPPTVKVLDASDNPVPGVAVTFSVATGGGVVTGAVATSSSAGIATLGTWTLGVVPGAQTLSVSRPGVAPITFTATATHFSGTLVAAGGSSTCGIGPTSQTFCWGLNDDGQLGDGTTDSDSVPTSVWNSLTLQAVAISARHACGITVTGSGRCWGYNSSGQLGDNTNVPRLTPVQVQNSPALAQIVVGDVHSCALDVTGAAWCWGNNANGRLGDNATPLANQNQPTPVQGAHVYTSVSAGNAHTCGVRADGQILCWGFNGNGRLGDGTATEKHLPTLVAAPVGVGPFMAVAAGGGHTCALTTAGAAYCWGQGGQGALGTGTNTSQLVPTAVVGGHTFTAISAGFNHTCGITVSSAVYCWGANANGRLGDGTVVNRLSPTPVTGGFLATAISLGGEHSCARSTYGSLVCWGRGFEGQLGNNDTGSWTAPVGVNPP